MATCPSDYCGVGGWGGPMPGDPDNNVSLSAVPAFGGIDVTWTMPVTYPEAVAYTKLYRGSTPSFASALLIAAVGGGFYYDKLDSSSQYWYWIEIVSRNGTVAPRIGPATAVAKPLIEDLITQLTGEIDSGVLANALRTDISRIDLVIGDLANEITARENGEITLSQAMEAVDAGVAETLTFLASEQTSRVDGDSALAEQIDLVAVTAEDNLAAAMTVLRAEISEIEISGVGPQITALSERIDQVETEAANNFSAVNTTMNSTITTLNGAVTYLEASYTARVQVNGLIGGFGILNNGTQVEAGFDVDRFWIGRTNENKRKPFIVDDGVVYIDEAAINKLSFSKLRNESGSFVVSDGKIGSLYVNPAATWLNSNITLNPDGSISGAGGGQVTIGGLGYTGDLNATRGAPAGTDVAGVPAATLVNTATTAAQAAADALDAANAANNLLSDITSDDKLTPSEKQLLRREWDSEVGMKTGIELQATIYDVPTEKAAYINALVALGTYLNNGTAWVFSTASPPLWLSTAQLTVTTTVVGETLRTNWKTFTDAKQGVLNAISSKARDLANAAQTTANGALTAAQDAEDAALAANAAVADMASDNKLTGPEKSVLRLQWDVEINAKAGLNAQATLFGLATENTAYNNAIQALGTYLNGGVAWTISTASPPSWISTANLGTTTDITGSTLRSNWQAMTDAKQVLLNAVAAKAKALADAAQTAANNAVTVAEDAEDAAAAAAVSAAAANTLLTDIASDDRLTALEKQSLRLEWDKEIVGKAGIEAQATAFGITTENTAFVNALVALGTYLNGGAAWSYSPSVIPLWISDAQLSTTTVIVGSTLRNNWSNYTSARQTLLNKIASEAAKRADWSLVTGPNKPEDGATSNRQFRSSSEPAPAGGLRENDVWINPSYNIGGGITIQRALIYKGGTWHTMGSYVTNTTQLVDGAGLGTKADWSQIANMPSFGAFATLNQITAANATTYISGAIIDVANIKLATIINLATLSQYTGTLTVDANGHIKGGQTAYATGTGFFLGYSGTTYKFSIGDANQYLRWTGTALEVKLNTVTLSATTPAGGSFAKNDTVTRSLGTCTVTASGGTAPYTYSWAYTWSFEGSVNDVDNRGSASFSSNTATLYARGDTDCSVAVQVTCTVTDANGLTATISRGAAGTFGTGPS